MVCRWGDVLAAPIASVRFVLQFWKVICILHFCSTNGVSHSQSVPSKVHFVSSCHFDVGFADTAANILNRYFDKFYASSIETSRALRQRQGKERLVFLTHTYLVSLYMLCPPGMGVHCPTDEEKETFTAAVKRGDIVWHAMPFNSELELLDKSMIEFSVKLTHDLDDKMGRNRTITMSQRDVPGTTRSLIPLLRAAGVEAITVGVNPGSMPPGVPSIFRWLDPVSGQDIIAMWHGNGYGGMNCCKKTDSVVVAGAADALMYGVRLDNQGPPPLDEVLSDWKAIQKIFPEAEIVATDYDSFVRAIKPYASKLPVYSREIGDTWIYGVPSDHFKTAAARVMMTSRTECLASGECSLNDYRFYNFSRLLLKASEHTWGLAYTSFLKDNVNFKNDQFHAVMNNTNYVKVADSWREQRDWSIFYAIEALDDHPLANDLRQELAEIRDIPLPDMAGFVKTSADTLFSAGDVKLSFVSSPFSINYLSVAGHVYASKESSTMLAALLYQSFSAKDFDTFMSHYLYVTPYHSWEAAFGKLGLENVTGIEHQEVYADLQAVWRKNYGQGMSTFLLQLSFPPSLVLNYGAPAAVWLNVTIGQSSPLHISLLIYNKTSTRLPESMSLQFRPLVANASSMMMDKLGEVFSVMDVGFNGSKHTHALGGGGVSYSSDPGLSFRTKHVPVTCIGKPTPFPTPMEQPDADAGFSFNIFNNIWGTNYVMWYPFDAGDGSFRSDFTVQFPG